MALDAGRTYLGGIARRRARLSRQIFHRLARPLQIETLKLADLLIAYVADAHAAGDTEALKILDRLAKSD
jgi:hypothetical protein